MKRYIALLLALLLLLPGCGKKQEETSGQDAETIAQVMLAPLEEHAEAYSLTWYLETQDIDQYLEDFYKLENFHWSDGAIVRMEGVHAFELAVLFTDEENVSSTVEALQQYLLRKRGAFTGYFPDQADMVDNALILTKGQCVALIICQDPDTAKAYFETCFGEGVNAQGIPAVLGPDEDDLRPDGRLIYVDPGIDDMTVFDNSAILAAWESGDDSSLSKEDKAVLDAAKKVLDEWTVPGAGKLEIESGLYAWLTTKVSYDRSHYEKRGAPRTSYEPYGPLMKGKGVCLGYATTFQLLMDMTGVECITVTGAAFQNRENHAWNMVRLNGEWYCVDSTWDHNDFPGSYQEYQELGLDQFRSYFNVTSQHMADTDHQWDYDNVPEATAEDRGRPQ